MWEQLGEFGPSPWPGMALVNPEPLEFTTFGDMAAHLDRWATRSLASPAEWTDVLVASRSWLDYSARNQALLASYDVVGPVAGRETWRLVASTTPDRLCDVRAGEHGYPVRVPVTTGGTEPDPYLGGHRPTRAAVEGWEWQPVYSVDQLARRPAPDVLAPAELPETLRGPGADHGFLTAVRKVATATVRGRLPRSDNPDQILAEAAARLRRSSKRPVPEPELRGQVAWLVAERVGHAATGQPPEFDPSGLSGRQRWERLVDVLEPARKLTAALGVATGVDLTASPLPRMAIVDDRVVPAGRRHRLPAASLEQLPIGRWVTVGPYTTGEWAPRGEHASGQGAYLRLNKTAYLVAVEHGDTAGWRLEDVATRTGHGLLATGTATTLDHARDDAVTAVRDRYPALTHPEPGTVAVSTSPGVGAGWEEMPGAGRTRAELRRLDEHTTVYVMAGPGGRWQPALHTTASGILERLPLEATLDDARDAAEVAGLRAIRVASVSDPARGDVALAEFADSAHYDRRELVALVSHRVDPADAQRLLSAEPAELVELLGAAGASPATTVAVLAAEHCDPTIVAGLLPTVGVPMPDAIRVLRDRWELPATVAAEHLGATATEMRQAGCTPVEIMAARPRDVLRTLPDTPHLWELAAGTMATAGHPLGQIAAHLAAHAPTPDAFAAGLTAVAEPADGLAAAAAGRAHPDQLAAASEAWGLDPHDTAHSLARVAAVDVVLDTLAIRCDHDPAATADIAAAVGIPSADVDRWLHRDTPTPVAEIRSGLDLDTDALLAALPPPGPTVDDDPIRRLDALTAHLEPMLEPAP